jgi:hypothetical protein
MTVPDGLPESNQHRLEHDIPAQPIKSEGVTMTQTLESTNEPEPFRVTLEMGPTCAPLTCADRNVEWWV